MSIEHRRIRIEHIFDAAWHWDPRLAVSNHLRISAAILIFYLSVVSHSHTLITRDDAALRPTATKKTQPAVRGSGKARIGGFEAWRP